MYIVDEVSRGMYFLNYGEFELREYRDDDIKSFKISPPKHLITATNTGGPTQREGSVATVGWLAEFALFEARLRTNE